MTTAKGRVDVTITHPDGTVEKGYYIETMSQADVSTSEARLKVYAMEFSLVSALLYLQPQEYTELCLDDAGCSNLAPGVH